MNTPYVEEIYPHPAIHTKKIAPPAASLCIYGVQGLSSVRTYILYSEPLVGVADMVPGVAKPCTHIATIRGSTHQKKLLNLLEVLARDGVVLEDISVSKWTNLINFFIYNTRSIYPIQKALEDILGT